MQPTCGWPDARYWRVGDAWLASARCDAAQAEALVHYDQHRVVIDGCWGILLTYHWSAEDIARGLCVVNVVFNPATEQDDSGATARAIVRRHPVALHDIRRIVEALPFTFV
jgi:hypothetical protein